MSRRVVVSGMGLVTAFGDDVNTVIDRMSYGENAVVVMDQWKDIDGLGSYVAAPIDSFFLPKEVYNRKKIRAMSRVSLFSTRATELALKDANLENSDAVTDGRMGIAFGSCSGSPDATKDIASIYHDKSIMQYDATTYVRMMPHTTAVNTALFFGMRGRLIPTSSACTSASQAIGYAYEAIAGGHQDFMVAGGAEELSPAQTACFDTLFATTHKNDTPKLTPSPFDKDRDGLVIGEGAGALLLESYDSAVARGAKIYCEIVGFNTNCDATHITQPNRETIEICIANALKNANLKAKDIGYVNLHATGTGRGDVAESLATYSIFGRDCPVSGFKSYFGHTLGACGAIEAALSIQMMHNKQFMPNLNLNTVDENCGDLDYIVGSPRDIDCQYIMSNNFAFGGVNTSLIFKKL